MQVFGRAARARFVAATQHYVMIRFKLRALVTQWEFQHQRRLPFTELAELTGIARTSLSKMVSPKPFNTTLANVDALCRFFGCAVGDLLEYVPDSP